MIFLIAGLFAVGSAASSAAWMAELKGVSNWLFIIISLACFTVGIALLKATL